MMAPSGTLKLQSAVEFPVRRGKSIHAKSLSAGRMSLRFIAAVGLMALLQYATNSNQDSSISVSLQSAEL